MRAAHPPHPSTKTDAGLSEGFRCPVCRNRIIQSVEHTVHGHLSSLTSEIGWYRTYMRYVSALWCRTRSRSEVRVHFVESCLASVKSAFICSAAALQQSVPTTVHTAHAQHALQTRQSLLIGLLSIQPTAAV